MISRIIKEDILKDLKNKHVTGLFGARRTGKTVLMQQIREEIGPEKVLMIQGEDLDVSEILSSQKLSVLKSFIAGYEYLFIDEAQKIPRIGVNLKLLVDNQPDLKIFITGSSSLELVQRTGEPLTGRSTWLYLFPFAQAELKEDFLEARQSLNMKLVYGLYPQVFLAKTTEEKVRILMSIRNGYLLRDILMLDNLKDPVFILNLLRLIAFQIGNDISYNELASTLNVNKRTVQRYLWLLEQAFIIFPLSGFSRNLRKEYSKTPRYYFWDNGIRNSIINNFTLPEARDDTGKLWENFCISERLKTSHYFHKMANFYFWRTYDRQEIDLIQDVSGQINGFEFKLNKATGRRLSVFTETYKNSSVIIINRDNFLDFVLFNS